MNKLYFVGETEESIGELVSAKNWEEANTFKKLLCGYEHGFKYQFSTKVVRGGMKFWMGEPGGSDSFIVKGTDIVITELPTGIVADWNDFINELKKQGLCEFVKDGE